MSEDNKEMLTLLKDISKEIGSIASNVEFIKQDNIFIKEKINKNTLEIDKLKDIINKHEEIIEKLDTDVTSIKSSINKFDKLDNKIFRFKQFIALVTYNNKYARVGLTALTWFILIAVALIILYNLIFLFNIDKKVVEDIVDIIK